MKNEIVILLHGIGHTKWNMLGVERALRKKGFHTLNISYPSLRNDIDTLATYLHRRCKEREVWNRNNKIHFVTHSMGGLVAKNYLQNFKQKIPSAKIGRVIMLAPPNKGSEVADLLENFKPYRWLFGPAGQELTVKNLEQCGIKPYYEMGVIAGDVGWPYTLGNISIKERHDGRVAVSRTKIDGMKDHIVVKATHSLIAWHPSIQKKIIGFIENGEFPDA